jgi:hypothetical protein
MKEVKEVEESSGERLVAREKILYCRGAESAERSGRQRRRNRRGGKTQCGENLADVKSGHYTTRLVARREALA